MDPRATLAPAAAPTGAARIEHAIFTSIRSPLGSGYRLVAASRGITEDEKRDILHAAPSHGSLCDESEEGAGLAAFTLGSGRWCLFVSRHAGVEHTGRGGYRVHTHVLVLEPETYRAFHWDPFLVATAAGHAADEAWVRRPPTSLVPLTLTPHDGAPTGGGLPGAVGQRGRALLAAVLSGRKLLVTGAPVDIAVLRHLWSGLPASVRADVTMSCGIRFSPARALAVVLVGADDSKAATLAGEHGLDVFEWEQPPAAERSPFRAWLDFVCRQWETGRVVELDALSRELTGPRDPAVWAAAAALCDDLERVSQADLEAIGEMQMRHTRAPRHDPVVARLAAELEQAVSVRRQALEAAEPTNGAQEAGGSGWQ